LNSFSAWFNTGFLHIADLQGYDHILFLFVLCGVYTQSQWKSLLVLITAFTIGHSLTLALSVMGIIKIDTALVEFLIPITILITCIHNLYHRNRIISGNFKGNYWLVLFFGLIHGLGFSNLLRSLLGGSESILSPLFAFNIGLEAGQLIILAVILLFSLALTSLFRIKRPDLIFFISAAVFGIAFIMAAERFKELLN
jgi:hypothetical protein